MSYSTVYCAAHSSVLVPVSPVNYITALLSEECSPPVFVSAPMSSATLSLCQPLLWASTVEPTETQLGQWFILSMYLYKHVTKQTDRFSCSSSEVMGTKLRPRLCLKALSRPVIILDLWTALDTTVCQDITCLGLYFHWRFATLSCPKREARIEPLYKLRSLTGFYIVMEETPGKT